MDDKIMKKYCPDCRYRMKFVKTEKQSPEFLKFIKTDKNSKEEEFNFLEIWNCLNCNENWEFDTITGSWKIKSLS